MDDDKEKVKVLLIEDDEDVLELYRLKLSLDNYEVITVTNGNSALEKAATTDPEIIFLDIKLPGMDGFEVLKKLRADPKTKAIPVVILSNFDEESMVQKGLTLGANDYFIKSQFSPSSLSDKIKEYLD